MGSDPSSFSGFEAISLFQSTLLAWGATNSALEQGFVSRISIHAPRMGSDTSLRPITCSASYFNPRSPHGERRGNHTRENIFLLISIHAPRMGSDFARTADCSHGVLISIHAPRMGSDYDIPLYVHPAQDFNPRPPHGERLYPLTRNRLPIQNFNPRPPHGERQDENCLCCI